MRLVAFLQEKLFRWQSDGTAPLRLGQRRIFILPSRGGLLYAVTLAVMLVGAINYNLALGHLLVFALAGIGVAGMVHAFRNLHGLLVTPGRSAPVFAGDLAHFELTLANDRPTPRLALELATQGGEKVSAAVDGKKDTKINIPLATTRRGWLALPRVRLSTRYPLGLFTAWAYLQPAMRCLVYPRPLASPLPAPTPSPAGGERRGDGGRDDFAGFRPRQPADSPRHVAWKASARQADGGSLLVKQFAGGAQVDLMLDWQQTDPDLDDESRFGILTGWVLAAEAAGIRYGLQLPNQALAPGAGEEHCRLCLETLALLGT